MNFLTDWIREWLQELFISGILANFESLFADVNNQVGEIAVQVGTSPADWHSGVFSLLQNLSDTVILPIAGVVLTFVMCYELIQMLIDRNNLHDIDTWIFFKWIFKTFVAVMILSNTWNIVMGVFELAQSVINGAAGLVQGSTEVTADLMADFEETLKEMEIGPLLGLWIQSMFLHLTLRAISAVIFVITYGRMVEIYMLTSIAPIPFATIVNRELGHTGHNYFKSLFAVGFQGLLIIVCVAIYAVLIQTVAITDNPISAVWMVVGYTVLLCYTLFKTGSLAKSVFGAH